jgi:vacuolar-type H+-ATPase subunit I/STV1
MTSVVALYDALTTAPDERTRARLIAEAFERLEERYPHLADLATKGHLRETELRLQKEIELVRADLETKVELVRAGLETKIEQVRADLAAKIEQVRADLRATELRLQKEIQEVRAELKLDIERVRGEVVRTKIDLLKWIVPLMFAQVAAIAALVKLL